MSEQRLIDADALIEKRNHAKNYDGEMYVIGQGYIMDAPTVDAVPVAHAEWIETDIKDKNGNYQHEVRCSACGKHPQLYHSLTDYCAKCGAKMDGGKL